MERAGKWRESGETRQTLFQSGDQSFSIITDKSGCKQATSMWCDENVLHSAVIGLKTHRPSISMRKASAVLRLKGILKNTQWVFLQAVELIKNKGSLRSGRRAVVAKENWGLNLMRCLGWNLAPAEGCWDKTSETWIVWHLISGDTSVLLP